MKNYIKADILSATSMQIFAKSKHAVDIVTLRCREKEKGQDHSCST